MEARIALLANEPGTCAEILAEAVEIAEEAGSWQPLITEVGNSPILESYAQEHARQYHRLLEAVDTLRRACDEHEAVPVTRDDMPGVQTFALRVATLGRELIERDGKQVTSADWRAITAKELFLYLLFNGPVTRERISLEFWPDSVPERVRSNFHTTLYRARQAVGEETITHVEGQYMINPDVATWCDAYEMEAVCRLGRLLPARDARAEDLWRQAVGLYQGDFLPQLFTDWAARRRQVYEDLYIEALHGVAECARTRGDFREAVRWLSRAVDVDPLREDSHRALMIVYSKMGEKQRILNQFETLSRTLRRELGVSPSDETLNLVRLLTQ
jgi:DNA-binding SARP family transcriptional activator